VGAVEEVTARFASVVDRPEQEVPLDEAALLIAAHAYPGLDVAQELGRLDRLADTCFAPTLDALVRHLFVDLGFVGNRQEYYDPRNSFLNDVVTRRRGIPISLSVLTLVVGRRLGVPLRGVSMPGHFLLRDVVSPDVFVDPYAGGRLLDRKGCMARFHDVQGADAEFDDSFLAPVGTHAILARMLANLRAIFLATSDRASLLWVLRLRSAIPTVPAEERGELASTLAAVGRFREAASELDVLADTLGGDLGRQYRSSADRLRARLN
jgi:regulator of sirC expression with transglutaminase-like and TPR domain